MNLFSLSSDALPKITFYILFSTESKILVKPIKLKFFFFTYEKNVKKFYTVDLILKIRSHISSGLLVMTSSEFCLLFQEFCKGKPWPDSGSHPRQ